MLSRVNSCALIGLDGVIVEVEVDFGQGLPHMAAESLFIGDLSLDSTVRHVRRVLPMAIVIYLKEFY